MCEQYSGYASPFQIGEYFDDAVRWGSPANPDIGQTDEFGLPTAPASEDERLAARGLLAMAAGE